jgi:hypothetical protein
LAEGVCTTPSLYFVIRILEPYIMSNCPIMYTRVEKIRHSEFSVGPRSFLIGFQSGDGYSEREDAQTPIRLPGVSINYDTMKSNMDLTYTNDMVRHPEPTAPPPKHLPLRNTTALEIVFPKAGHSKTRIRSHPSAVSPLFNETTSGTVREGLPRRRSRKSDSFDSNLSGEDAVTPRRNSEG